MFLDRKSESPKDRKCLKYNNHMFFLADFPDLRPCGHQNNIYICPIILKGCLALSNQTERQAEIKPIVF